MLVPLAAGTVGALGGVRLAGESDTAAVEQSGGAPSPVSIPAVPSPEVAVPSTTPRPVPVAIDRGTLTALPGSGNNLALTVDDGANSDVVGAYIRFARDSGARFTFFVTGQFESWTVHSEQLRPLVESGQIQLGNHSWSHPDLTTMADAAVADQLGRTKPFLRNTFGVDGTPYYRPPFGRHNTAVDRVAADLGYTVPTMWYGSLSDSGLITEDYLLDCARRYFNAQAIVIGHANHPPVTHVYGQLLDIIRERRLDLVTLNDVLLPPP
ncbi:polysaccharide deacetylase family protein [Nocardia crassostreae]|uniref:polysaccharide deacetylase family protein n=1 Tax=Nocardia crassostreae TaxID=53428 RepID=UPI0008360FEC|nr:polysaccharide deacetylase family protein [Nocardia crassostreae]